MCIKLRDVTRVEKNEWEKSEWEYKALKKKHCGIICTFAFENDLIEHNNETLAKANNASNLT